MSALLREVAPRGGVPTFIALRAGGEGLDRICLAHRVPPASLPAIDRLRGLRHPHLARTLGVATIEEAPHALVALHAAEPLVRLRDRLARGGRSGLPGPVLARVAVQIADALAALHARGATHGAVDPRRVALDYDGRAVLLDTALTVAREAAPEDDVMGLGRLLLALCPDLPPPLADLARRARVGELRAADAGAAIDAWRRADAAAAAVADAQVARFVQRICARRHAAWQAVDAAFRGEGPTRRGLDGLVELLGAPPESGQVGKL